jgi:hypothetical protein
MLGRVLGSFPPLSQYLPYAISRITFPFHLNTLYNANTVRRNIMFAEQDKVKSGLHVREGRVRILKLANLIFQLFNKIFFIVGRFGFLSNVMLPT